MKNNKYAIRKVDDLNWQIFQWQEGGQTIERGRYVGQETQAKWCPMESYHPTLVWAVQGLLKTAALDNAEAGVNLDTAAILAAVEQARLDVLAAVAAVTPEEFTKKSARGRKPKEDTDGS